MPQSFSLVIRGGTIVDGNCGAPVVGDVVVVDSKIAQVGRCRRAAIAAPA